MSDHLPEQNDTTRERKQSSQERKPDLRSNDPYAVLGLKRHASLRTAKYAYFELVRQYPPETHAEEFKLVRTAYDKLRTEEAKAETDLFLFQPPPPWKPRSQLQKLDLTFNPQDIWLLLQTRGDLGADESSADYRPVKI
ncbi:MAG: DnaJ domain-containing protein [Anaerolineaceae bacterium]|nr:DnaJ domain-containing protein [Anaerolineaceae bacterium]